MSFLIGLTLILSFSFSNSSQGDCAKSMGSPSLAISSREQFDALTLQDKIRTLSFYINSPHELQLQFIKLLPQVEATDHSFNGVAAEYVAQESNRGDLHIGMYFLSREGEKRVIKILTDRLVYSRRIKHFLKELQGAFMMQDLKGPTIYDFGVTEVHGELYPYVEMNNILTTTGGKVFSHLNNKNIVFLRRDDGRITIDLMIDLILDAYEKGYVPKDPDFVISREAVSWIDFSLWHFPQKGRLPGEISKVISLLAEEFGSHGERVLDIARNKIKTRFSEKDRLRKFSDKKP